MLDKIVAKKELTKEMEEELEIFLDKYKSNFVQ